MNDGWLCDSILKTAARPSPMSTAPAFSPGPCTTRGPSVGSVRRCFLLLLYEQCSDHMTENSPSSVRLGSRPRAFTIRSYSSRVRLCWARISGLTGIQPDSIRPGASPPRVTPAPGDALQSVNRAGMNVNYIHLAIPVFFLLIGIEVVAAQFLERDVYRLNDSINDLSCGILDQVADVFLKTVLFAGYLFLFEHGRLFSIPSTSAWAWALCFIGVDGLYYWFHRWSHEANAGWAAHVVHHQSEEMNLAVALRQGALQ